MRLNCSVPGIVGVGLFGLAGILGYKLYSEKKEQNKQSAPKLSSKPEVAEVARQVAQNTSGQADAAVIDVVNATRIDQLLKALAVIDKNKAGADEELLLLKEEIQKLLTSNRGGSKGIHGFIGETSQVHISNIKAFINGEEPLYILLDDNSMTDYTRGFEIIQQKACQSGGYLGLDAIKRHSVKYPEFLEGGGIYQIPKDMFAKYMKLKDLPQSTALKLRKEDLRLWRYIRAFTEENPDIRIEPMEVSYSDIQAGNIEDTVKRVEDNTANEFDNQRKAAHEEYSPSIEEFLKICSVSAAIEGGISAGTEFVQKLKSGKKLSEFTKQDIKDVGAKFVVGSGKGAFRGGAIYIATNIYKIPAAVASGIITALFGIGREGYLLMKRKITGSQFVKNSGFVVLETADSTICAHLGKSACKKHPILGALLGGLLGSAGVGHVRKMAFA